MLILLAGVLWGQLPRLEVPGLKGGGEKAGQVKVEVVPQYKVAVIGPRFVLAVVLDIPEGWHLYANPKRGELGIDTEIIPQESQVLRFGRVMYPEGRKYEDPALHSSNHIYEGRVICYVPTRILPENLAKEYPGFLSAEKPIDVPVTLELKGLLCGESGTCLPCEEKATTTIKLSNAALGSYTDRLDLFAGLDSKAIDWNGGGGTGKANAEAEGGKVVIPDYQPRELAGAAITAGDWLRPLLLALVAGLLLNVMPCVLPVIPLKVLSLVQQSREEAYQGDKYRAVKLALVFSGGILLVFAALAVVMSGFQVLYGQQFQSDAFKLAMLLIVYVMALSMFGIFEVVIPGRISNIAVVKEGYAGALGMGVLATLLATPCSAPLLGPVLAWSLSRPAGITVAVFLVVGVGMAAPYVLLTAFPKLLHRLPKAGMWMVRLKQGLGFVMLGVCVYLIFLFSPGWHLPLLIFCLLLAFGIWLALGVVNFNTPAGRRHLARVVAVVAIGAGAVLLWTMKPEVVKQQSQNWLAARLVALHQEGRTVMVEFTADWCPNCKYVEQTVLKRQAFQDKLRETGTELIIADWTQNDPAITEMLNRLGSKSIPFAAIFPGKNPLQPIVLRDIYGLDAALAALEQAR